MIVYHGSNSNFKHLKISTALSKRNYNNSLDNEGPGIYFSTDKELARSYGKYIYTLELNDKYFIDFRHQSACNEYLSKISQEIFNKFRIEILNFIDMHRIADRMRWGGLMISNISREIANCLDNNAEWYRLVNKTTREKIYSFLRAYDRKHLYSYMFTYNIPNIGVIKNVDDNVVKIVGKENSY